MNFQKLQNRIVAWRDKKLNATLQGSIAHLKEEAGDLEQNPYDPLSLADVGILWMGICNEAGFSMDEMLVAMESKMAINESRVWGEADEQGIVRYIKETKV